MVFADLFFLFGFLPAFAICYLLAKLLDKGFESFRSRNFVLVLFSLIFYAWGEPIYVLLMIVCVLMNYLAGLVIDRAKGGWRTTALVFGLICNILILGTFKYANFIAETLCMCGLQVTNLHIALPIGISFYTFQSISYLVDVYRRESPAQRRFMNLLLYISMFPQLIAGPIVRYDTVAREISNRHASADDIAEGLYRFILGLGKKVIIANQISVISDQLLGGLSDQTTTVGAATGILAFSLQIYFDFSGYSDMAIGIGRCLGFHFKENFDHPYCCLSITDFWRRWHMSLGSFFRDYIYIPMGGNR
ncbi:MAG: MBOAT family protein, partial [Paludibacteraceae bacterium]|nr:MBOAT family protein [Paludibacteraceae bacterium]